MVTPAAASPTELRLRKIEALRELAGARLRPPERDRVLDLIAAAVARGSGGAAHPGSDPVLRRAEEKLAQTEADREEKRRPYEADPLFMYLWRRRFGTREYDAGRLTRYLDRKVAHLIGYEAARVNYAMLIELPDRMREHVERLRREPRGSSAPDDAGLAAALASLERHPQVMALIEDTRARPGGEEPILRRIEEVDRALGPANAASFGP